MTKTLAVDGIKKDQATAIVATYGAAQDPDAIFMFDVDI